MSKVEPRIAYSRAFEIAMGEDGLYGTKMEKKVNDCILDYIQAVRGHGLRYRPVIFGLKRWGEGMTLIACSEAIKRNYPDGIQLNRDAYPAAEALMVAAEMNRIFDRF